MSNHDFVKDYACFWFVRQTVGDFRVSLKNLDGGLYRLTVSEDDSRDPFKGTFTFGSYRAACDYFDILVRQVLNDTDEDHPFVSFQYSVPYFPTVSMPIQHLGCEESYKAFTDAVDFFFSE
jgi:hypothetical protein